MARLTSAQSLEGLRRVWDNMGDHYRRDAEVVAHKDKMKASLSK